MSLVLFGDTVRSAALRHELPLAIIDPLLWVEHGGRHHVMTSWLERERIARVSPGAELLDFFALGLRDLVRGGMTISQAERETVLRALEQIGVREAAVPADFPLALAERLRGGGIRVTVDEQVFLQRRRAKAPHELAGIRAAQRAAEAAMSAARELLREWGGSGELRAEDVRGLLRETCARHGALCPPDVIVASRWSGHGHDPGHGPLPGGLPITIDLWPCDEQSGCWADMTRTFLVGEAPLEHAGLIAENHRLSLLALEAAREAVRPGVTGQTLFERACRVFEEAGRSTQRTGGGPEGFQFSLGHGVGLEVHEDPSLGIGGHQGLVAGDVLALEPGLWDDRIGEVRVEDLVLVTDDGCETLTEFPYELGV